MASDQPAFAAFHSTSALAPLNLAWTRSVAAYVTTLAVSNDGSLLALGTGEGDICVFDARSGEEKFHRTAHAAGAVALSWCGSGRRRLASCGNDGCARVFDVTGTELGRLPRASSGWSEPLGWSPDGTQLAVASGCCVRVWSDHSVFETEPHEGSVTGLAWTHRGDAFVTACDGGVRWFEADSRVAARRWPNQAPLTSLCFSADDAWLAGVTRNHSVRILGLATSRGAELAGFCANPRSLDWNAVGDLLATAGDTKVAAWDFREPVPERQRPILLVGHHALCTVVAFNPQHEALASGSDDTRVLLWRPRLTNAAIAFGQLEDTVTALGWALAGSSIVAADARGTLRSWLLP